VQSGHWPLFPYAPARAAQGKNPLHLDCDAASIPYRRFAESETRFSMLWQSHPEAAEAFLEQSQKDVLTRYHHYRQLAELPCSTDADNTGSTGEER